MEPTTDPYAPESLLRRLAAENATLRGLLGAVAGDLERLAAEHAEHAES